MNISIITIVFPYPNSGILSGIENSVENLAISLKKLGHQVKIVTTFWNGGERNDSYKSIPILRINDSKALFGKIGSIFQFNHLTFGLNLIRKKNFKFFSDSDAIIMPLALGFTKFFKYKKIPLLSIFHHFETPSKVIEYFTIPFYNYLAKKQFKIHKKIIVRTNYIKDQVSKRFKIKKSNIHIIPDGVKSEDFNPNKRDLNIKRMYEKNLLLCVGPFYFRKKISILLKSMPYILKKLPNTHLILIGEGPTLGSCIQLSRVLGIEKKVSFLGYVEKKILLKYFATCDLFVFPSEVEGFGQVLIEAMSSGTPVICANKLPMSEIIENGGITFKFNDSKDLANKIISLLTNPTKLENLKSQLLIIANKYNWINIAKKYIELINAVNLNINYSNQHRREYT